MEITLREITKDNWEECIKLKVGPGQDNFVASNLYSIAESKFEPDCSSKHKKESDVTSAPLR